MFGYELDEYVGEYQDYLALGYYSIRWLKIFKVRVRVI